MTYLSLANSRNTRLDYSTSLRKRIFTLLIIGVDVNGAARPRESIDLCICTYLRRPYGLYGCRANTICPRQSGITVIFVTFPTAVWDKSSGSPICCEAASFLQTFHLHSASVNRDELSCSSMRRKVTLWPPWGLSSCSRRNPSDKVCSDSIIIIQVEMEASWLLLPFFVAKRLFVHLCLI